MSKELNRAGSPSGRRGRAMPLAAAATAGPAAAGGAPSVALPLPAAGPLPAGLAALGLGAVAPGLSGLSPAPLRPATVPDGGAPSAADALAWLAAAKSSSSSAADSPSGPRPSGLSWRSGASCSASGFAGWRGRAMDVHVGFTEHDTWDRMLKHFRGGYFRGFVRRTPQVVVSLPMMPRSAKRQHAACARGQFDATFRQIGALLVQAGAGNAIIRLGWEANIGSDSHPWGIDGTRDIPDYKRCFQREVAALKATAPNLKIEWTNAKRGSMSVSTLESYPGDQSVDLMGIHYYNNTPKIVTDRDWEAMYKATHNKGPWGLGEWLKAAKARGRKLGIGEWGQWARSGESFSQADNPVYIDQMHRFFRANANDLAYENYFNCRQEHQIYPTKGLPKSSSRYRELWASGR